MAFSKSENKTSVNPLSSPSDLKILRISSQERPASSIHLENFGVARRVSISLRVIVPDPPEPAILSKVFTYSLHSFDFSFAVACSSESDADKVVFKNIAVITRTTANVTKHTYNMVKRPKKGCTSSNNRRYWIKPPGAIVISKTVNIEFVQVPNRLNMNFLNSSSSVSSIKGCMTCAMNIAPRSMSTNSSVIDQPSAPTEFTTAVTNTLKDLNAFITLTTRSTFANLMSRISRKTATLPKTSPPLPPRGIQESAIEVTTIIASRKLEGWRK
mmetsp:Transcript_83417/g.131747  ORF Transcript_83417/g.131747 Transcript_83417/m.131747 type:complete len:271 (-) Transcript_83417:749-1561(-)